MRCLNPRRLPNPASTSIEDSYIQIGCGKCYACLSNRRRGWLFRLYHEYLNSLFSIFLTLTYSDDFYDGQLHKEHLQKYFKKLRHYEDFTYYAIGEFGTHTYRAHYHVVLFFKSASTESSILDYYYLLSDNWKFGFSCASRVNYRRLNYVLHYHVRPKEPKDGLHTWQLFSKRLGITFLDDATINYLYKTQSTTIRDFNGNLYVVPRYYRKKLSELGYDITPPVTYDDDYSVKRIEKVFNKPIYEISESEKVDYLHYLKNMSDKKIKQFNNQDKLR